MSGHLDLVMALGPGMHRRRAASCAARGPPYHGMPLPHRVPPFPPVPESPTCPQFPHLLAHQAITSASGTVYINGPMFFAPCTLCPKCWLCPTHAFVPHLLADQAMASVAGDSPTRLARAAYSAAAATVRGLW